MKLVIDYEPTPKGVPRVRFVNGKAITYYHPHTTQALVDVRKIIASMGIMPFPAHVSIAMTVVFSRTRPKWSLKREKLPCRKPDLDNFLKLTLDVITGLVVPDDAQITSINAHKVWSDNGHGSIIIELQEDKPSA